MEAKGITKDYDMGEIKVRAIKKIDLQIESGKFYAIVGKNIEKEYLETLMDLLGIKRLRNKFPSQLSGGEQQRVAIGRALVTKPSIIFADEPTGNLDEKNSHDVLQIFQAVKKELGQTILLVTHDMGIAHMADKMLYIQDGMILKVVIE